MPNQVTSITTPRKAVGRQRVVSPRIRRNFEPQMPSIRAGIFGEWLNGVLDRQLANRYGCRVEFIQAIVRAESRKMRDELRAEIERSRRAA